jgi:hypothetical protein
MTWSQIPKDPPARILRQFSAAWVLVFGLLAATQLWRHHHGPAASALGAVAALGIVGLAYPALMRWVFVAASIAAFPIGWVVTQLILGVLFYLVLTPLALFFRIKGRDALKLRRPTPGAPLWETRGPASDPARYLRQF